MQPLPRLPNVKTLEFKYFQAKIHIILGHFPKI